MRRRLKKLGPKPDMPRPHRTTSNKFANRLSGFMREAPHLLYSPVLYRSSNCRELNVAARLGTSRHTHTPPGTCDHARVTRTGPSTRRTGDTKVTPLHDKSRTHADSRSGRGLGSLRESRRVARDRRPAHNPNKRKGGAVLTPRTGPHSRSCRMPADTAGHRADTSHTQYPCKRSRSSRRRLCPVYRSMPAPNGMPSGCRAHRPAHTHTITIP